MRQCNKRIAQHPKKMQDAENDLAGWVAQLASVKKLLPLETALRRITSTELPEAKAAAEQLELKLPNVTAQADAVRFFLFPR